MLNDFEKLGQVAHKLHLYRKEGVVQVAQVETERPKQRVDIPIFPLFGRLLAEIVIVQDKFALTNADVVERHVTMCNAVFMQPENGAENIPQKAIAILADQSNPNADVLDLIQTKNAMPCDALLAHIMALHSRVKIGQTIGVFPNGRIYILNRKRNRRTFLDGTRNFDASLVLPFGLKLLGGATRAQGYVTVSTAAIGRHFTRGVGGMYKKRKIRGRFIVGSDTIKSFTRGAKWDVNGGREMYSLIALRMRNVLE